MAEVAGFEPTNNGVKTRCLTAWRHLNICRLLRLSRPFNPTLRHRLIPSQIKHYSGYTLYSLEPSSVQSSFCRGTSSTICLERDSHRLSETSSLLDFRHTLGNDPVLQCVLHQFLIRWDWYSVFEIGCSSNSIYHCCSINHLRLGLLRVCILYSFVAPNLAVDQTAINSSRN